MLTKFYTPIVGVIDCVQQPLWKLNSFEPTNYAKNWCEKGLAYVTYQVFHRTNCNKD